MGISIAKRTNKQRNGVIVWTGYGIFSRNRFFGIFFYYLQEFSTGKKELIKKTGPITMKGCENEIKTIFVGSYK